MEYISWHAVRIWGLYIKQIQIRLCSLNNNNNTAWYIYYVVSPQIILLPLNYGEWVDPLRSSYNEELVISCPLEGNPPAKYQWNFTRYEDGHDTVLTNNYNVTLLNNNRTLHIEEFHEEHNGIYSCSAENFLGKSTFQRFRTIKVNSKLINYT